MIQMFLKNTDSGLNTLRLLIRNKEWEKVSDLAHKISAPCRHLKAEKLYNLINQIEQKAGKEEQQAIEKMLTQARNEFNRIRKDIKSHPEFNLI